MAIRLSDDGTLDIEDATADHECQRPEDASPLSALEFEALPETYEQDESGNWWYIAPSGLYCRA